MPAMPVMQRTTNRLLAALPAHERDRCLAACMQVELVYGGSLQEDGERIRHAYFPTGGFISLLATVDARATLEVGMIGDEGMYGHELALGGDVASLRALTQGAGSAWRMPASKFLRCLRDMPSLHKLVDRYAYVQSRQIARNAACARFHVIEKRLARWLLMTADRAHAETFYVTQGFLAFMLGVRRVGVTEAAGALQSRGLIRYRRGKVAITDRERLAAAACTCYRSDLETYRQGMDRWIRKTGVSRGPHAQPSR